MSLLDALPLAAGWAAFDVHGLGCWIEVLARISQSPERADADKAVQRLRQLASHLSDDYAIFAALTAMQREMLIATLGAYGLADDMPRIADRARLARPDGVAAPVPDPGYPTRFDLRVARRSLGGVLHSPRPDVGFITPVVIDSAGARLEHRALSPKERDTSSGYCLFSHLTGHDLVEVRLPLQLTPAMLTNGVWYHGPRRFDLLGGSRLLCKPTTAKQIQGLST